MEATEQARVIQPPPTDSVYLVPASGLDDELHLLFIRLVHKHRIQDAHRLASEMLQRRRNARWRTNSGITYQLQGKIAMSECAFRRALDADLSPAQVAGLLANLASGQFRAGNYESAQELALRAVLTRPTIVAPYLIGSATAGKLRDPIVMRDWAKLMATAMPNFWSRPVSGAFISDPDSLAFRHSTAFHDILSPLRARGTGPRSSQAAAVASFETLS